MSYVPMNEQEKTYQRYLLKKQIDFLKNKKGYHTELITLMIPPDKKISDVTNYLKNEINESSNIKSKLTRKNVIDSITSLLQKLKTIKKIPENGLIMFSGAIPQGNTAGTEKNELYMIEPIEPISTFKYYCSSEFYIQPLEEMMTEKATYGIIVIDNKDFAIGWVRGNHIEVVRTESSGVSNRHHAGGQSQRRFERLFDEHVNYFLTEASEITNDVFVPMAEEGILEGIFIGGAGHTKYKFRDKGLLDYRIRDKIVDFVDIGVSGSEGLRAVVIKAGKQMESLRYMSEKKIMQKFLYNLSRDTGLVAYGEKEVRQALQHGAVEKLLLSEELDMSRVTVECEQCNNMKVKTIKNSELKEFKDKIEKESCDECKSSLYSITEIKDIVPDLAEMARNTSAEIEMISIETEEGESLLSTFGGIAAILRYAIR
ncbi:MAG: peptide chain release factor 1 [Candidatus Lokiarchaeota archaeon]|nr:peptide chain release factor 1 [Candidatus Lokiarchaeota archaeon]